jgi:hypothetical protein
MAGECFKKGGEVHYLLRRISSSMTFMIKPRPRNDGVTLASEALSFPMWYGNAADAVYYAKFRAGNQAARIDVLDATGAILETIAHDPRGRDNANTLGGV